VEFKKQISKGEKKREREANQETDSYRELIVTRGEVGGGMAGIGDGD